MLSRSMMVFSGNAHPELTSEIVSRLNLPLGKAIVGQFSDGEVMVEIQGNCDERGTNEYNLALGERRAKSAQAYLVNLGVNPDRIGTVSFGEERPLVPGQNEEAWAKNRRDDFVIIK